MHYILPTKTLEYAKNCARSVSRKSFLGNKNFSRCSVLTLLKNEEIKVQSLRHLALKVDFYQERMKVFLLNQKKSSREHKKNGKEFREFCEENVAQAACAPTDAVHTKRERG